MRFRQGFVWLFGSLFLLAAAQGQKPAFKQERVHGRDAYVLKLIVTVIDEKTGRPIENLQVSNFSVMDDKTPLRVVSAQYQKHLLDVMVLLDTSALGEVVRPLGAAFIDRLGEMGYLVDSSSHYILGVGVPALVASTIVL